MTTRFRDLILRGDHTARDALVDPPEGTLFVCTTHGVIDRRGASAWEEWWNGVETVTLGALSDVDTTGAVEGQTIVLDGTGTWIPGDIDGASGPRTINGQTGTTYTLVVADAGDDKMVTLSNTGAVVLTVPPVSAQAFPVGSIVHVAQVNTGRVRVNPGAGVTVVSPTGSTYLDGIYAVAQLVHIATDVWVLTGDVGSTRRVPSTILSDHTLAVGDEQHKFLLLDDASPLTVTVPPDSGAPFPDGSIVTLMQAGAGQVTVAPGVGVTVNSATGTFDLDGQYAVAELLKTGTNEWVLYGRLTES